MSTRQPGACSPTGEFKTASVPTAPRQLRQTGRSRDTISLRWLIADNVVHTQIVAHTFKVISVATGEDMLVPSTNAPPDQQGCYRHKLSLEGSGSAQAYRVQVRAQALNGEYGPYCLEQVCHTSG